MLRTLVLLWRLFVCIDVLGCASRAWSADLATCPAPPTPAKASDALQIAISAAETAKTTKSPCDIEAAAKAWEAADIPPASVEKVKTAADSTSDPADKKTASKDTPANGGYFLDKFKFGADGISIVMPSIQSPDQEVPTLLADSADLGANIAYTYDQVQHKDSETFKGAIGYDFKDSDILRKFDFKKVPILKNILPHSVDKTDGNPTIPLDAAVFVKADFESQTSNIRTSGTPAPLPTYSSENLQVGFAWSLISNNKKANEQSVTLEAFAQPYYLKDYLRKSELYGSDLRFVPIGEILNQYNSLDSILGGGFLVDGRFDYGHFSQPGMSLGQPVPQAGKAAATTGPVPLYLPNEDYARLGGRIGGFFQLQANDNAKDIVNWILKAVLDDRPLTGSIYYLDFYPLSGVRHGFGEAVCSFRCRSASDCPSHSTTLRDAPRTSSSRSAAGAFP
jgi:hypothetical protein